MNIKQIIEEFNNFSEQIKAYTSPASRSDMELFENMHSIALPLQYKQLLSFSNGIMLMGSEIYGVGDRCLGTSLNEAYNIEHYLVSNPMPDYLVPFSPDGYGNHYCFDVRNQCIDFWQHDLTISDNTSNCVYETLFEMINEVFYQWTLEWYDHEGNELKDQ